MSLDFIDHLALGVQAAATWQNLGVAFFGCLLGTVNGVLPATYRVSATISGSGSASLTVGGSAAHWAGRLGVTFATPSQLLELSRGLAAKVSSHVRGSHDTASGTKEVMFASEVTDPNGAPLPVPGAFLLAIPVFKRGDLYPVPVRLRFRIKESVTWSYELARVDAVFEHAFAEACDHVAKLTTLPVLRGDAER